MKENKDIQKSKDFIWDKLTPQEQDLIRDYINKKDTKRWECYILPRVIVSVDGVYTGIRTVDWFYYRRIMSAIKGVRYFLDSHNSFDRSIFSVLFFLLFIAIVLFFIVLFVSIFNCI